MRLDLTGRNVDITPALRQHLSRKLGRIQRLMQDSALSAQVVLTRERYRHLTDITLHARGDNTLAALGAADTWDASMAQAIERITHQAQRVKEKWTTRKRRGSSTRQPPAETTAPAPATEAPVAAPVRYAIRRHTLKGAVSRLTRGSEAFVLFRHDATMRLTLVFRQRDGTVGLIEPEV
jgi:putative sigma-54 modulation protein